MTVICPFDDEHEVCCDADALDAIQAEAEREDASGADVAALAGTIIAARKSGYGTEISISRPASRPSSPPARRRHAGLRWLLAAGRQLAGC